MINEFSRSELLLGPDSMNRLKNTTIALFGIGGVGSHCAEALARAGIGTLILADNDRVSLTNINRQSIAYHSTEMCIRDRDQGMNQRMHGAAEFQVSAQAYGHIL